MRSLPLTAVAPAPVLLPALVPAADRLIDSPVTTVAILGALSLLSFGLVMVTSFVKVAVVLSVLRSAIGTPQIPPTLVITGIAFVLSATIMAPVAREAYRRAEPGIERLRQGQGSTAEQTATLVGAVRAAGEPLRAFLKRHAQARERATFLQLSRQLSAPGDRAGITGDDFLVLVPAFLITELKEAFIIGFFLFVPFLVIDLVVANVLLALGMHMLSPTTISLPFKFLLFVLVDGWHLLCQGLVQGYLP